MISQDQDAFLQAAKRTPVDLEDWAVQMMERHNRKSHLAPQLSPSTQSLLRGDLIPSPSKESSASKTPTSGEIPIAGDDVKPSPPSDTPIVQRALPADTNSAGLYDSQSSNFARQAFPPRTSSSSGASSSRSRDNNAISITSALQFRQKDNDSFNLPIRPAPPPSGPLPPPPNASFRNSTSRRQGANGNGYPNGEGSQY